MPGLDELFSTVETYPNMTMDCLLVSVCSLISTYPRHPAPGPRRALLETRGMTHSRANRFSA
ncbi:hypothetical protein C8Q74DRAFT_1225511 [Fomes fomentarius]|nr:hypothetical protein C8Q74DRAFT_1225511 [Fomes fomentarius]